VQQPTPHPHNCGAESTNKQDLADVPAFTPHHCPRRVGSPVRAGPKSADDYAGIRGTIEKLDGKMLTVKSRDGQTLTIILADNLGVSALVKQRLRARRCAGQHGPGRHREFAPFEPVTEGPRWR
jgi:hypothetical protein